MRIGLGYDVHRLVPDRRLVLGGVHVPCKLGLEGHSDADVLLHAICDAMLGAAALGDIGSHFPDTDVHWRGADSRRLLRIVSDMVESNGFSVGNLDVTIALERPRLRPLIDEMRRTIAKLLDIDVDRISVKATTGEAMGFVGRREGVAAWAVCLLEESQ